MQAKLHINIHSNDLNRHCVFALFLASRALNDESGVFASWTTETNKKYTPETKMQVPFTPVLDLVRLGLKLGGSRFLFECSPVHPLVTPRDHWLVHQLFSPRDSS